MDELLRECVRQDVLSRLRKSFPTTFKTHLGIPPVSPESFNAFMFEVLAHSSVIGGSDRNEELLPGYELTVADGSPSLRNAVWQVFFRGVQSGNKSVDAFLAAANGFLQDEGHMKELRTMIDRARQSDAANPLVCDGIQERFMAWVNERLAVCLPSLLSVLQEELTQLQGSFRELCESSLAMMDQSILPATKRRRTDGETSHAADISDALPGCVVVSEDGGKKTVCFSLDPALTAASSVMRRMNTAHEIRRGHAVKLWRRYFTSDASRSAHRATRDVSLDEDDTDASFADLQGVICRRVDGPHNAEAIDACRIRFNHAVWILLHRYQTLFGPRSGEGSGWQLAAPSAVHDMLREVFDVHHECFASPLNAHHSTFNSLFPDVDRPFGSRGSFFADESFSGGGAYEVGPPYDVGVMERMVEKLLSHLSTAKESGVSLSFYLVLPDWDVSSINRLFNCPFHQWSFTLPKRHHRYCSGLQHQRKNKHQYVLCETPTLMMGLETRPTTDRPVDPDVLKSLIKAWMP
mmetsp:Transcript_44689/g.126286  ORF Transcript_44689/g.126286 Transcript_44689/m.126286 type:complete len:521 (+) Transcript_44689:3-1565(+)